MVNVSYIAGWFVVYSLIALFASNRELLPERFNASGPLLTIRSQIGISLADRIAGYKRTLSVWGKSGVAMMGVIGVLSLVLLVVTAQQFISSPEQVITSGPQDVLVIPGVNPFLPLSVVWELAIGLGLALVVHEGGHAIMCRYGDIAIDSTGIVLFGLLPIGAFVEPDEESQDHASFWSRVRMFSAGIANNILLTAVCVVLLFGVFAAGITTAPGLGVGAVYDDSPAENAEVEKGDRIVEVNGNPVAETVQVTNTSNGSFTATTQDGQTHTIEATPFVVSAPQEAGLQPGASIASVSGVSTETPAETVSALSNISEPAATVTLANGTTNTVVVGAYGVLNVSGEISGQTSLDANDPVRVLSVGESRVHSPAELAARLDNVTARTTSVTLYHNGSTVTQQVSTQAIRSEIQLTRGVAGFQFVQLGVQKFPAESYLSLIQFELSDSLVQQLGALLVLPFAGATQALTYNFPGFSPFIEGFYTVEFLSGHAQSAWFFTASTLFWTAWININLAIFNCIPTFALDGGLVFGDVVDKYATPLSESQQTWLVYAVKTATLLLILVMVFGPLVL